MIPIPERIKKKRLQLKETQTQFAKRFQTYQVTVHRWETGKYEAPFQVIEFVMRDVWGDNVIIIY